MCGLEYVFGLQRSIRGMLVKGFFFLKNRIRLMLKILGYLTGLGFNFQPWLKCLLHDLWLKIRWWDFACTTTTTYGPIILKKIVLGLLYGMFWRKIKAAAFSLLLERWR